jgi:hypothetical protein
MADKKAIAQALNRKKELEDQIEIAKDTGDDGTAEGLEDELQDIKKYLNRISFHGRVKMARPGNAKLAHSKIKTAFTRTRQKIAKEMPQLAVYLKKHVNPEAGCAWRYTQSEPPIEWLTKIEEADPQDDQHDLESDVPPF